MAKKPIKNYQKVQAGTASAGQRVIMVYEGIAKNLNVALKSFDDDSPEKVEQIHNALQLAEKLITELKVALDKENGGEIAENLESLYDFWISHISEANARKDKTKIEEILSMVQELVDSWRQAERNVRKSDS